MFIYKIVPFILLLLHCEAVSNGSAYCKHYKDGPSVDVRDMVGIWMTVYTQPNTVSCFTMNIRATTELEREQLTLRYGNFGGRCDWSKCLLQIESANEKHFLQGDGYDSGLLLNIVIDEDEKGRFELQDQSPDQWSMYGRRGSELLLMRDCSAEGLAIFTRAPYWPTPTDIYAILHRGGVRPQQRQRVICAPTNHCVTNVITN